MMRLSLHLPNGVCDLCPQQIDLRIKLLQSKDLELWVRLRQKAEKAGCRDEADHDCFVREMAMKARLDKCLLCVRLLELSKK